MPLRRLSVIMKSGTEAQKKMAENIAPVRKTGNRLLCVLLIGNTAVRDVCRACLWMPF